MMESLVSIAAYPRGALLFLEGQPVRGVFILCTGSVKLYASSPSGKTVILATVQAGDVVGLPACISGRPYEATAETMEPTQANFIARSDFLKLLSASPEVIMKVAQQLTLEYQNAYAEIRALTLSGSNTEKIARLLFTGPMTGARTSDITSALRLR